MDDVKTITITDDELINVATKICAKAFPNDYFKFGLYLAMIMAEIFSDDEYKNEPNDKEAVISYTAGDWRIFIKTLPSNKVQLAMYRDDVKVIDRVLDSLYKAYNYAFNILVD